MYRIGEGTVVNEDCSFTENFFHVIMTSMEKVKGEMHYDYNCNCGRRQ